MVKKIPNIISLIRLSGVPVLVWLLLVYPDEMRIEAIVLFIILALTDLLDGYLARKLDAVSDLGALLDPLVDKLLILAPLIAMVGMHSQSTGYSYVPSWMVILLLAREMWITGLRGLAATKNIVISAGELGKVKTFLQVIAVCFLILHDEKLFLLDDEWITGQYIGLQALLTALLLAYWSGLEYTMRFFSEESG